jgi:hypothetical protein
MKYKWTITFLLITLTCFHSNSQSQNSMLRIIILDTTNNTPLENAIIKIENPERKAPRYITTDSLGVGIVYLSTIASSIIIISHLGYITKTLRVNELIANKTTYIYLNLSPKELTPITINSPPLRLNGDTIEFKASQYNQDKNATLGDLLKNMPGIQISKNGIITAFGKPITTIRINGIDLVISDPTILSQNLPADIISKLQLINDKNNPDKISGFNDGSHQQVLNLVLKKSVADNYIGNTSLGYTLDNKYSGYARMFRFKDENQILAIGDANNLNGRFNPNLATEGTPSNNNQTITTAFSRKLCSNLSLTLSFSYKKTQSVANETQIINYYLDTTYSAKYLSTNNNKQWNYEIGASLSYGISNSDSLIFGIKFSPSRITSNNLDSFYFYNNKNILTNNGIQEIYSNNSNIPFKINIDWLHNLNRGGEKIINSLSIYSYNSNTINSSKTENINISNNATDTSSLYENTYSNNETYNYTSKFITPISNKSQLQLSYHVIVGTSPTITNTYDVNKNILILNDSLSYHQSYATISQILSVNYKYDYRKISFDAGLGSGPTYLQSNIESIDTPSKIAQRYLFITPHLYAFYTINKSQNIHVEYNGRNQFPSSEELLSIPNYTNPLSVQRGNSNLSSEYIHQLLLSYQSIYPSSGTSLIANAEINLYRNEITSNTVTVPGGGQQITPINTNGNFSIKSNFNFDHLFLKNRLDINITGVANYNQSVIEANNISNIEKIWSLEPNLKIIYNTTNWLHLTLLGYLNKNITKYSLDSEASIHVNQFDIQQSAGVDITKCLSFKYGLEYKFQTGAAEVINSNPILVNLSIIEEINKRTFIQLGINDLLNQNTGYSFKTGAGYQENDNTIFMARYFILEFKWKFQYHTSHSNQ